MTPEQKQQIEQIRERVKRLERAAKDPHVKTWDAAYYGDVYFLLSLVKSQEEVRESVSCACHTFDLDPVIRAYLSDKFIHTTVACPALPLGDDQNCLICHHDRKFYNAEADACEHTMGLTRIDIFCGCACRFPIPDAATSMRSACVEKVKAMRDHWRTAGKFEIEEYAEAAERIITALESVSIQEQKS